MTILFREDFTAPTLDTSKWATGWFGSGITHPVNGAERAAYDPACVTIKNGKLHLHLERKPVLVGQTTYPERTGCVTTYDKFSTPDTNYSVEARIFLPGTPTAIDDWPAFWLDGYGEWPKTGENDILEGLGGKAGWHYHSPAGGPGGSVTMDAGWHDLRCEVRGSLATYFYDGKQVGQLTVVQAPQFIIIGNQSGTYGGADVPDDLRVDWVAVESL